MAVVYRSECEASSRKKNDKRLPREDGDQRGGFYLGRAP